METLFESIRAGVRRLFLEPQLLYTLLVAIVIILAFVYTAERFISIARDAQERLYNIRVGSIQDAYAPFAGFSFDNKEVLRSALLETKRTNETIRDFYVLDIRGTTTEVYVSGNQEEEGKTFEGLAQLITLARSDKEHSFTTELLGENERLFATTRAIQKDGTVIGVILTTQTLSEADLKIEREIKNSLIVLLCILLGLLILFFRHSKIIDYATLYQRLRDIDQLKDDFISMASHELRTPLTIIRGYADLLTTALSKDEKAKQSVNAIATASEQLELLVADMLDVSRIEQGRLSLSLAPVRFSEEVTRIAEQFRIQAEAKKLTFSILGSTQGTALLDIARVRQIFVNLIGNAIKYTEKGGVEIKLEEDKEVFRVRISDTGIGMKADDTKRLFQKFYRVENEKTKGIPGTGLGLWITKQLIDKMGGTISIESINSVGTHVIVEFPKSKS